ncbi:MAG: hypothetical protein ACYS0I_16715, partial [Planctomycetota bacterium]
LFTNDDFWLVSADTKTCGSPRFFPPTGGSPCTTRVQGWYYTKLQTKVNKKNGPWVHNDRRRATKLSRPEFAN